MRRWIPIALFLLAASTVQADPVSLGGGSVITFPIVAIAALLVEAGVVALLLTLSGLALLPTFGGFFITNLMVFVSLFCTQLLGHTMPIPLFELLAVAADCVCIKLLCAFEVFQGDGFQGVTWLRALLISCAGNAISFFVGLTAQRLF